MHREQHSICISGTSRSTSKEIIDICIRDADFKIISEYEMELEDFARAITRMGFQPINVKERE